MTKYTFDTNLYSDFFKDTYGFRPRNDNFYHPDTTDDERQAMWDSLLDSHSREMNHQEQLEKERIAEFEQLVLDTIGYGAGDRKTAIRWILDGLDDHHDAGYMCYSLGIPYTYEGEITEAVQ